MGITIAADSISAALSNGFLSALVLIGIAAELYALQRSLLPMVNESAKNQSAFKCLIGPAYFRRTHLPNRVFL